MMAPRSIPGPAGLLQALLAARAPPAGVHAALCEALRQHGAGSVVTDSSAALAFLALPSSNPLADLAHAYPSWRAAMGCFDIPDVAANAAGQDLLIRCRIMLELSKMPNSCRAVERLLSTCNK
jgi:hypothetical protein